MSRVIKFVMRLPLDLMEEVDEWSEDRGWSRQKGIRAIIRKGMKAPEKASPAQIPLPLPALPTPTTTGREDLDRRLIQMAEANEETLRDTFLKAVTYGLNLMENPASITCPSCIMRNGAEVVELIKEFEDKARQVTIIQTSMDDVVDDRPLGFRSDGTHIPEEEERKTNRVFKLPPRKPSVEDRLLALESFQPELSAAVEEGLSAHLEYITGLDKRVTKLEKKR